jgi:hypothetical protein
MSDTFSNDTTEIVLYFKSNTDENIAKLSSNYKTSSEFNDVIKFINKTTPMGSDDDDDNDDEITGGGGMV